MTEIPDHLLKRSRERRAAIGQGKDVSPRSVEATQTHSNPDPAQVSAVASAPVQRAEIPAQEDPAPPAPDPHYVAAAKQRRKVPFWAMATLSLMPVWGFMYVRALTTSATAEPGPLGLGAEVYSGCASCHGGDGEGVTGLGYPFADGEILDTFPHIEDHIRYVYYGTDQYNLAGVEIYGDPDRTSGPHITGSRGVMPQQGSNIGGSLTDEEIVAVVCHERYSLGGADPDSDSYAEEFEAWCAAEAPAFAAIVDGVFDLQTNEPPIILGTDGEPLQLTPVGDVPIDGTG